MSGIDLADLRHRLGITIYSLESWYFGDDLAATTLKEHFHVASLDGLGLGDYNCGVIAAGSLLKYLYETQKTTLDHMTTIEPYSTGKFMVLDSSTRRNLELVETLREKQKRGSLLWVLDKTKTAMGARTLRSYLEQPLIDKKKDRSPTGYVEELQADSDEEAESRLENIEELRNKIVAYEESCEAEDEKSTLSGFLEQVALVADIDSLDEETDYVVLMTLHSAKGLEFPHVYLAGLEDGIFPSYMTITADDPAELEEERRLCYVGITRAKENLTLTCARRRMVHGETQYNKMSRFLKEIPLSLLSTGALFKKEQTEEEPKVSAYRQAKQAFATKAFAATKPAQQFTVTKGKGPGYDVGDRVRHIKFGEGLVTQITEGGRDYEVTVDFDTAGTKKMFAMFAKLQKID